MDVFVAIAPWLVAMLLLVACSGMFSASEAAFFYLKLEDRKRFRKGTTAQRAAASLLADPDRLLSAILFWNLMVNVAYFAVASIVSIRLQDKLGSAYATAFSTISLVVIIFFSEMMPKSLAVLRASSLAALLAVPIAFAVRMIDPIRPIMRGVSTISQRLIWPRFEAEPYMQVSDLERAIHMSMQSSTVLEQEEMALRGIVSLSDSLAAELMRPRMRYKMFQPPVSLKDLDCEMTPSGYLLIADEQGDDVVSAINLIDATELPQENLEEIAQEVLVFPWCAQASEVFQQMLASENEVAAVVNELGETIGVVTLRDLMETIFSNSHGRSERILQRKTFEEVEPGVFLISGMTSVRRMSKHFHLELPETRHATINGILQEELDGIPEVDDEVDWGPFHFLVVEQLGEGHILVRMTLRQDEE
ncbi:CNNM domain-containing protein [Blastopirellula marina]|uniref:CNNM transmembrane domain-containing protein n=1 Tax=Blastopirellula marina TaxID=124 RepID=A0A2S8F805_9BACT|nr:CNNM domain-containing protein [Blastopirellula marina]PQO28283.1 hypothetical protein C5Y98_25645 [Blastopirellula marina]PTL41823.1 DUF21 domain-containing protein [Blastopirellula marina]